MDVKQLNERIDEVLAGVGAGDFDDVTRIPDGYRYQHLLAMYYGIDALSGGESIFRNLYTIVTRFAEHTVREKAARGRVRVAFLTYSAAMWQAESLYRLLTADERFETFIVVAPVVGRDVAGKIAYRETYKYFVSYDYDVRAGYDETEDKIHGWDDIGGAPDILINLSPYFDSLPPELAMDELPLGVLNIYIPYGIYLVENTERSYLRDNAYNLPFMNLVWRIYMDSKTNVKGYQKHQLLKGANVVYSGFPKMDFFYQTRLRTDDDVRTLWKLPDGKQTDEIKRVIVAPHHSLSPDHIIQFGTFRYNAQFLLELAKKYANEVSFVFKPHPNLRAMAVAEHVFTDDDAYDAYLAEWDALPNARVVTEGDYLELFATSDAMIMDSGSFAGEYLYADKPLLFLTRKGQAFGALGEACMTAHYQVPCDDFDAIEDFVRRTVLGEEDPKAWTRKKVFSAELDYVTKNRMKAGEKIYRDILAVCGRTT